MLSVYRRFGKVLSSLAVWMDYAGSGMKLASSAPEFTATVNSHIIMTIVNN
jgi:hypothetical protein